MVHENPPSTGPTPRAPRAPRLQDLTSSFSSESQLGSGVQDGGSKDSMQVRGSSRSVGSGQELGESLTLLTGSK